MEDIKISMLNVDRLTIKQGDKLLWQDLSFCLTVKERFGFYAPSGFGKSTLGRVIAQWQPAFSGTVLLDKQPISQKHYCPIQLVPQHPEQSFNPYRTVKAGLYDAWIPNEAWLDKLCIEHQWLNRRPSELSGGEIARLALLRALDPRTKFLIMDESTAQLDAVIQAKIWQTLIEESNTRPLGMIIFSHNRILLEKVCTKIFSYSTDSI